MGEADANDDKGLEVVEERQGRPPWQTRNVPNWPQEPTPAKLTGVHAMKVPLGSYLKAQTLVTHINGKKLRLNVKKLFKTFKRCLNVY